MESVNLSSFYISEEGRKEFQSLIEPLVQRTYEDATFKKEFIENPQAIIKRETGSDIELPGKSRFVVVDKSDPFALYITLPVDENMLELTDEELELVAGGAAENGLCIRINWRQCKITETTSGSDSSGGSGDPVDPSPTT